MTRTQPHLNARRLLAQAALLLAAAGSLVPLGLAVQELVPLLSPTLSASAEHEDEEEEEEEEGRDRAANRQNGPHVLEGAFAQESYAPSSSAHLRLFTAATDVVVRVFRVGPEGIRWRRNDLMHGVEAKRPLRLRSVEAGRVVAIRIGDWPSGLYFARLSGVGKLGFAPFVVRPRRLGTNRVAVVLPTYTWQAYNFRDDDGDGESDTWYAGAGRQAHLARPYLNRGVPNHFRSYDLPFLRWLDRTGRDVDVLTDSDLERIGAGAPLKRAYDLIVFPGHHEYVTTREYDAIEQYRDRGGRLAFLSANNLFWRVLRTGDALSRTVKWRELGRPEAAVIGVQYIANDMGEHRGPWRLTRQAPHWLLRHSGLRAGMPVSNGGIEIDRTAPSSPRGVRVLAEMPNVLGPGLTAHMTYYETPRGARVFAAGAFTLAGAVFQPPVRALMENVWSRLTAAQAS